MVQSCKFQPRDIRLMWVTVDYDEDDPYGGESYQVYVSAGLERRKVQEARRRSRPNTRRQQKKIAARMGVTIKQFRAPLEIPW